MGMRVWLAVATLASGVAWAAACQSSAFACQSDGACPEGRCEPQGWCSFPDASCPSGFRFAEHAAEGLAGVCVNIEVGGTDATTTEASTTTTATMASFTADGSSTTQQPDGSETTRSTSPADTSGSSTSDDRGTDSTGPTRPMVVTVPIAADADDGAMYDTPEGELVWVPSGEDEMGSGFFGEYPDGEYYVAYFRFALPEQADTRTLLDAHLRLEATSQLTYMWGDTQAVGIWIESSEDAPAVTGPDAFPPLLGGMSLAGVSLLEPTIRWPESGPLTWMPGVNTSPDVSPLINALGDEFGGLPSGSYVQLWLAVATPTGVGGEVTYVDYASRLDTPPELELTFEMP